MKEVADDNGGYRTKHEVSPAVHGMKNATFNGGGGNGLKGPFDRRLCLQRKRRRKMEMNNDIIKQDGIVDQ